MSHPLSQPHPSSLGRFRIRPSVTDPTFPPFVSIKLNSADSTECKIMYWSILMYSRSRDINPAVRAESSSTPARGCRSLTLSPVIRILLMHLPCL